MNIKYLLKCMSNEIETIFCIDGDLVVDYHHNFKPFAFKDVVEFINICSEYIENNSDKIFDNRDSLVKQLKEKCSEIYSVIEKVDDSDIYLMSNSQFVYDFILENLTAFDLYKNYWGLSEYQMVKRYIKRNDLENEMVQIDSETVMIIVE